MSFDHCENDLLEYSWWGSVFLINVPVAAVALVAAPVFIPRRAVRIEVGWTKVMTWSLKAIVSVSDLSPP